MADYTDLDMSEKPVTVSYAGKTFGGTTDFSSSTFSGKGGNFKNAVFEGPATFNSAKFYSGADFTGAVFKDHADFENAEFYGGKVDFSNAVFLAGASFKNAKFGRPYQRIFGEWEIRFSSEKESNGEEFYTLKTRKVGNAAEKWKKLDRISVLPERGFGFNLESWEERHEYRHLVVTAFNKFRENPQSVSFAGCRFGEIKIDGFSAEEIERMIVEERARIKKAQGIKLDEEKQSLKLFEDKYKENKFNGLSSELEKTVIMYTLTKHLEREDLRDRYLYREKQEVVFTQTSFYPQGNVDFARALFLTGGDIGFSSATFSNGGDIGFSSATFSNGGDVWFDSTNFSNDGDVWFDSTNFSNSGCVSFNFATFYNDGGYVSFNSASFSNSWYVSFNSTTFYNADDVSFNSATFSNDGDVWFDSTNFSNGRKVRFDYVTFTNKGEIGFSKIVWINGRDLDFSTTEFGETLSLKFDECLFLCARNISFNEARFPEKGSLMFQRCYFGRTKEVDFTGAFFRHTSFEGGEISWLKKDGETILKERLGEKKYDSLPEKTREALETGETLVFERGVEVLWKDLTTESAKNITLRRVNLSHSIFDGMTLSHIQLNAPQWFEKGGRRMLFEETTIERDIGNLENIEDQYTQLKNNLEKQGNYQNAGYFHYGEQEIRREILWKKRSLFNWFLSWCYKWLSGYGEKPLWAFISTFVIAFLFSFVLAWLNTNPKVETLWANICFFSCWLSFLQELMTTDVCKLFKSFVEIGIEKSFKSFVELITPFSWKETATSLAEWTKLKGFKAWRLPLLIIFQVLFLGIQLPLLVLAVRRRFKR